MDQSIGGDQGEVAESLTIHQRIAAIRAEVPPKVVHDKQHKDKSGNKILFSYPSHNAVTEHLRDQLVKYGVLVIPRVVKRSDNGNRCELDVMVEFASVDRPDDKIEMLIVGYGVDNADKGPGKAFTYAEKMAKLKLFQLIGSDEDVEDFDATHDPTEPRASTISREREIATTAQVQFAAQLKAEIEQAPHLDSLRYIRRESRAALADLPAVTQSYFSRMFAEREATLKPLTDEEKESADND